jgi:hypothetical protein
MRKDTFSASSRYNGKGRMPGIPPLSWDIIYHDSDGWESVFTTVTSEALAHKVITALRKKVDVNIIAAMVAESRIDY